MAKSLTTYKFSLTKELVTVLAIKAVLLLLLWYFFFSPQHKTYVDEKKYGRYVKDAHQM